MNVRDVRREPWQERAAGARTRQRALLVAVDEGAAAAWPVEDRLRELGELARTAGAQVIGTVTQRRRRPDPALLLGEGKIEQIAARCQREQVNLVLFDRELTPAQARNLEDRLGVGVLDRTQLILDIFAQRAQTHEGKLQVELAQLRYTLPRLAGIGAHLSRLGGGIGTRGPGETKLETDRRRIRDRVRDLERDLVRVRRHRQVMRKRRARVDLPVIALVGYTNAGKSTMLRALSGAEAFVENRLFATLDPKVRRIDLPHNLSALLTDTVGFIHDLPHPLIAAFRATLEEVVQADLLLHVVDVSHPRARDTVTAVQQVLAELGAADKPVVTALNKVDLLQGQAVPARFERLPAAVATAGARGRGLERLREALAAALRAQRERIHLRIPYERMDLLDLVHRTGDVHREAYRDDGIDLVADVDRRVAGQVRGRLRHEAG